jgi:hypothetical protein
MLAWALLHRELVAGVVAAPLFALGIRIAWRQSRDPCTVGTPGCTCRRSG